MGFLFDTRTRVEQQFETRLKALKDYQAKHGHMDVNKHENTSLYSWIGNVRRSYKKIKEGRTVPKFKLTTKRIQMLQQIGFEFEPKTNLSYAQFKSRIEALRFYQKKHGHMNVSVKEDKLLNTFISNVRQSIKRVEKGQPPLNLTPERITALEHIGFNIKQKRSQLIVSGQCKSSKRQRVEERLHEKHETIPITRKLTAGNENENENEEVEEIEGDIIPQWLISDDKEEDNDTNLYKDISIKIEGGTNVLV